MLTELACWFFSAIFSLARVNNPDILGDTAAYNLTGWREPGFLENETQSAAWGAWVEERLKGGNSFKAILDIPANELEVHSTRARWHPEQGFAAGMTLPGELWKAMSGFYESPEQAAATWIGTATCGAEPKPDPTPHPEGVFATVRNLGEAFAESDLLEIEIAEYGPFSRVRTWANYTMAFLKDYLSGSLKVGLKDGALEARLEIEATENPRGLELIDIVDTEENELKIYNYTNQLIAICSLTPSIVTFPEGVWVPLAEGEHRLEGSNFSWVSVASASNRSGAFSGEKLQGSFSVKPGLDLAQLTQVGLNTVADAARESWIMGAAPQEASGPAPLAGLKAIATATYELENTTDVFHAVAFRADQTGATPVRTHAGNFVEFNTTIKFTPIVGPEGEFDTELSLGPCTGSTEGAGPSREDGILRFTARLEPFTGGNPVAYLEANTQEGRAVLWGGVSLKCSEPFNAPIGLPIYLGELNFSALGDQEETISGAVKAETTTWMLAAEKTPEEIAIKFGTFEFGSHSSGVLNGTVVLGSQRESFSAPALFGREAAENQTVGWAASGNAVYEAYESSRKNARRLNKMSV